MFGVYCAVGLGMVNAGGGLVVAAGGVTIVEAVPARAASFVALSFQATLEKDMVREVVAFGREEVRVTDCATQLEPTVA